MTRLVLVADATHGRSRRYPIADPQAMYEQADETVRSVLNKAFFTRLYVDGDKIAEPGLREPLRPAGHQLPAALTGPARAGLPPTQRHGHAGPHNQQRRTPDGVRR